MQILLLDADGVVLKKHRYFSERFAEEQGVPLDAVAPFFKNEFARCQVGEADLREAVAPYLPKWKWEEGVDAFLNYWFTTDTFPDDAVLARVAELRSTGACVYLASGQEKYRAAYITKLLADKLDGYFYTSDLGVRKSEPEFFRLVLSALHTTGDQVTYFDDSEAYLAAARTVGIDARLYTDIDTLAV